MAGGERGGHLQHRPLGITERHPQLQGDGECQQEDAKLVHSKGQGRHFNVKKNFEKYHFLKKT